MSVDMVTGMTTGRPRKRVSIPGRRTRFLVLQRAQNDSETHTPLFSEYRQLSEGKSGRRVMLLASSQTYEAIH
jgi:hypothetical protein